MNRGRFRVRDDRGEWTSVPYRSGTEQWGDLTRDERRALDAERNLLWLRHLLVSRRLQVLAWAGALTVGLAAAVIISDAGSGGALEISDLVGVAIAAGAAVTVAACRRGLLRYLISYQLAKGAGAGASMCASCGYCLSGLVSEPDGCTVCPECGAAWRLRPVSPPPS